MHPLASRARSILLLTLIALVPASLAAAPPTRDELRARKLAARRYAGLAIALPQSAFANGLRVCQRDLPSGIVGYWKVPPKIVDAMDAELFVYLRKSGLDKRLPFAPKLYLRQYAGFVKDGQRFVYINALLVQRNNPLAEQAKKSFPASCSGLDGYWGIQYDTQAKKFVEFAGR
jgi:hypothetical protein